MGTKMGQKTTIRAEEKGNILSASCCSQKLASLVVEYSFSVWKYSYGILLTVLAHGYFCLQCCCRPVDS